MAKSTFVIEWEAHEYEHKERSSDWYWIAGIITAALVLVAFIFGNVILGLLILLSAFSLTLFINKPPVNVPASVTESGVTKGSTFYPYETLHSFWIDIEHPHKKVFLRSKKVFMPLIIVPLADEVDTEKLHSALKSQLREEFLRLSIIESALEYLGF